MHVDIFVCTLVEPDASRVVTTVAGSGNAAHADVTVAINRGDGVRMVQGLPAGDYLDIETGEMLSSQNIAVQPRSIRLLRRNPD